jgi:hypothetical protein
MTTGQMIAAGGGLFLLYNLLRRQIGGGTLLFNADRVHSFKFEGATPVITFGLRVQNTSNQIFNINSLAASVTSDGYNIGTVSSFVVQQIPANSERIVFVTARLQPIGIVQQLIQAFTTKDFSFDVQLRGWANVDRLQMPVSLTFKIGYGS